MAANVPRVTVDRQARPVEYDLKIRVEFEAGGGATASTCSWRNPDMMPALRQMFGVGAAEKIAGLVIDERGITAEFKRG